MAGYAKLFSDIVDSSIWEEDPFTCKVWVTLLALSDPDGFVRGSPGWLAGKSRVTIEQCSSALEKFKSPDPRSRTPDYDGRRIEQLEDGWLILNYLSFRNRLSNDSQAVKTRLRVRKHRERNNALRNACNVTPPLSASASGSVQDQEGGVGEGTEIPTLKEVTVYGEGRNVLPEVCKEFFDYYQGNNLWLNRHERMIDWRHRLCSWNEKAKGKPGRAQTPAAVIYAAEAQKKIIEDQISKHKANPQSIFYDSKCTDLDKAALRALRLKIFELNETISKQQIT